MTTDTEDYKLFKVGHSTTWPIPNINYAYVVARNYNSAVQLNPTSNLTLTVETEYFGYPSCSMVFSDSGQLSASDYRSIAALFTEVANILEDNQNES